MFPRILDLPNLLKKKSFFLFGPRATGKSFLIRHQFPKTVPIINLLRSELYLLLSAKPYELESMIKSYQDYHLVVIDEVQRVPMLLNEVHRLIEEQGIQFLLTGSSARKLHKNDVNLLAGRAWEANLFPLTSREIPDFELERYLQYGGLPPVYASAEPEEELVAYVDTYLREEIQAEGLVRKIPAFSRFLLTSALTSGQILNFTAIASDAGVPVASIREYYQILQDTFIGFFVPGWTKTLKRKATSSAKFYFFDLGVRNTLAQIKSLPPQSNLFGQAFEHFIALEIRAYLSYRRKREPLNYWRTQHGQEVDFIIGGKIAIEVKTTDRVTEKHLQGLHLLAEEKICERYLLISFDTVARRYAECELLYWRDFLNQLWNDQII